MTLMLRTGIPVSVWEREEPAVMATAIQLLNAGDSTEGGGQESAVLIAGGGRG